MTRLHSVKSPQLGEVDCTQARGSIPASSSRETIGSGGASVRATAGDIGESGLAGGVEGRVSPADGGLARLDEEVVEEGEAGGGDRCRA